MSKKNNKRLTNKECEDVRSELDKELNKLKKLVKTNNKENPNG